MQNKNEAEFIHRKLMKNVKCNQLLIFLKDDLLLNQHFAIKSQFLYLENIKLNETNFCIQLKFAYVLKAFFVYSSLYLLHWSSIPLNFNSSIFLLFLSYNINNILHSLYAIYNKKVLNTIIIQALTKYSYKLFSMITNYNIKQVHIPIVTNISVANFKFIQHYS